MGLVPIDHYWTEDARVSEHPAYTFGPLADRLLQLFAWQEKQV
ncbi:hypothetical protein [Roseibium sp.]